MNEFCQKKEIEEPDDNKHRFQENDLKLNFV